MIDASLGEAFRGSFFGQEKSRIGSVHSGIVPLGQGVHGFGIEIE